MSREAAAYARSTISQSGSTPRRILWGWADRVAEILERYGDRVPSFLIAIAIAVLMLLAVTCSRGGYAHPELEQYVPHYLSHRPVLQKIFDYKKVEIWPVYRPRPISYLVDNYDVAFIGWSCRHGFPHLLALSNYAFWIGDCLLLWFYFHRRLGIHRLTAALLICLFSTDPVIFFNGYFHSAKHGGTFFLVGAFVLFAECFRATLQNRSKLRRATLAVLGAVVLFCGCLFDEIPVAFAAAAALMLAIEWVIGRGTQLAKASSTVLTAIVLVLIAFAYYDIVLNPKLIWMITGERASRAYQTGTATALFSQPALTILGSLSVFWDAFTYLAGNISAVLGCILLLALISTWWDSSRAQLRIIIGGLLMLGCLYGMLARHPPIMQLAVRRSPYVLPLTMVFLFFIGVTVAIRLVSGGYLSRGKLQVVLLVLLASNVVAVLTIRAFGGGDEFTKILLVSLRNPSAFDAEAREDPDVARVQHAVLESPLYKSLRQEMTQPH